MKDKELRLSPSTINLYLKDPCLFIMKHFYNMTSDTNIYAIRGQAVEMAVNEMFKGSNLEESVNKALDFYYTQTFDLPVDTLDIEYILPQWAEKAITTLENLGMEDSRAPLMQTQLNFEIEGVPFKAFLDYEYKTRTIDLKTCNKLPSLITRGDRKGKLPTDKADNVRQQCIYQSVTGKYAQLLYVTNTDHLLYQIKDDEYEMYMSQVKDVVKDIKRITKEGLEAAISLTRPNEKLFNSFYWNKNMIDKAKEIWGLKDAFDL